MEVTAVDRIGSRLVWLVVWLLWLRCKLVGWLDFSGWRYDCKVTKLLTGVASAERIF
jgi:hypothetical protein